jgi:hypothetical protein
LSTSFCAPQASLRPQDQARQAITKEQCDLDRARAWLAQVATEKLVEVKSAARTRNAPLEISSTPLARTPLARQIARSATPVMRFARS